MESFNDGTPIGQYQFFYLTNCPSVLYQKFTFLSDVIVFNSETYTDTSNTKYIYFNKTVNGQNCSVTNDAPDTEESFIDATNGTYIFNGDNIHIINSDGDQQIIPLTFITNTKIRIGDIVLNKQ
jgi:hypothetical protein